MLPSDLVFAGRFHLLGQIARGGMAVKVIHERFAADPGFRQLFIDEAKHSVNLVHGNIVQIYQLGEADHRLFIAMELIRGSPSGS